jgi:hypothetical protein
MRLSILAISISILACLVSQAWAQDDYLDPGNRGASGAAREEVGAAMQSEIFDVSSHGMSTKTPQASRYSTGSVYLGKSQNSAAAAPASQVQTSASVAGRWRLDMVDSMTRSADLTLYQSEGTVFGRGTLTVGNDTQQVAVSGSAVGNNLALDLVSTRDLSLFRLMLTINSGSASGNYNLFSASGTAAKSGTASGRQNS